MSKEDTDRGHWGRQVEFLLTMLGFAVGLGNIWRFPYMCLRNGGGAFLIPYAFALFIVGIPLFYLELFIGQFSGHCGVTAWSVVPLVKGIGWAMTIVLYVVSIYYGHVVTYVLYYLGVSFFPNLPWLSCNNTWNTENCFQRSTNTSMNSTENWNPGNATLQLTLTSNVSLLDVSRKTVSPGEEFLQYDVLELSDDIGNFGGMQWKLVLCHVAGWAVVSLCSISGIKSVGKVVYVTATAPYILLTILLVRGCLLPGSLQGILYYIKPEWSKLLEFRIWVEAALQSFYSIEAFGGGNLALASYNKFNNDFQRDAILVCLANGLTSFYGGFAIFSILGYMSHETGVPVDQVIKSGPGLAFIVYPEALSKLPLPQLWSVLFFLMLATLGIGTQFGHMQGVNAGLQDAFPVLKGKGRLILLGHTVSAVIIGFLFCTRAGMYWFQLFDWYAAVFTLVLCAIFGTLAIAWIYGMNRLFRDISLMRGSKPWVGLKVLVGGITPAFIIVCFGYSAAGFAKPKYGDYEYPGWAIGMGWVVGMLSMGQIPLWVVIGLVRTKGTFVQRIKTLCRPTHRWRPQLKELWATYRYQIKPLETDEGSKLPDVPVLNGTHVEVQHLDDTKV